MTDVLSPLPGTFYQRPSPDQPTFKAPGDPVSLGDVLGLVEVMKTFIEVTAEAAGTFVDYAVPDAGPVQAGDAVARLEG